MVRIFRPHTAAQPASRALYRTMTSSQRKTEKEPDVLHRRVEPILRHWDQSTFKGQKLRLALRCCAGFNQAIHHAIMITNERTWEDSLLHNNGSHLVDPGETLPGRRLSNKLRDVYSTSANGGQYPVIYYRCRCLMPGAQRLGMVRRYSAPKFTGHVFADPPNEATAWRASSQHLNTPGAKCWPRRFRLVERSAISNGHGALALLQEVLLITSIYVQ